MMKGSVFSLLVFFLFSANPTILRAEMNPKLKAFLVVSGYGAAGGALLGLASMAFGTEPSAIAQGASLGLYAGIGFGTYVVMTHRNRYNGGTEFYQNSSPYSDPVPAGGGAGNTLSSPGRSNGRGFFDGEQFAPDHDMINNMQQAQTFRMPLFSHRF